ncbi:hypothetical protein I5860_009490 [Clostridioides difficile]
MFRIYRETLSRFVRRFMDGGRLSDIAPTVLDMMKLEKPEEMTGHSLISK